MPPSSNSSANALHGAKSDTTAGAFYRLRPDEEVTSEMSPILYSDGFCSTCLSSRGPRQFPITRRLTSPMKTDLAYVSQGLHLVHIMTPALKKFLIRLGLAESNFALVEDSAGRELAELCPVGNQIRWVGLKESVGIKANAIRCANCRKEMFMFMHRVWGKGIFANMSIEDAQGFQGDVAVAGFEGSAEVLLTTSGQVELLKEKSLRKLVLGRVSVVPPEEIDHDWWRLPEADESEPHEPTIAR